MKDASMAQGKHPGGGGAPWLFGACVNSKRAGLQIMPFSKIEGCACAVRCKSHECSAGRALRIEAAWLDERRRNNKRGLLCAADVNFL